MEVSKILEGLPQLLIIFGLIILIGIIFTLAISLISYIMTDEEKSKKKKKGKEDENNSYSDRD